MMSASNYRKRKIYDRYLSNVDISGTANQARLIFNVFIQPHPVPHREHNAFQLHLILLHML